MAEYNTRMIDEFRAKGGRGVSHPLSDRLLLLTTKGAKTGRTLTVPLAYHKDGDRYVVAATKGGAPTHPAWFHNLSKHRDVTVEVGTEKFKARAIPIAKGAERDRLYEAHASEMPVFRGYPQKTKRVIPVVALERSP